MEKTQGKRNATKEGSEGSNGEGDGSNGILLSLLPTDAVVSDHVHKKTKTNHDVPEDVQKHHDAMLLVHEIPAVSNPSHSNRDVMNVPMGLDSIGLNGHLTMPTPSIFNLNTGGIAGYSAAAMHTQSMWQFNHLSLPTTTGAAAGAAGAAAGSSGGSGSGSHSSSLFLPYGPPWPKKATKYVQPNNPTSVATASQQATSLQANILSQMSAGENNALLSIPPFALMSRDEGGGSGLGSGSGLDSIGHEGAAAATAATAAGNNETTTSSSHINPSSMSLHMAEAASSSAASSSSSSSSSKKGTKPKTTKETAGSSSVRGPGRLSSGITGGDDEGQGYYHRYDQSTSSPPFLFTPLVSPLYLSCTTFILTISSPISSHLTIYHSL